MVKKIIKSSLSIFIQLSMLLIIGCLVITSVQRAKGKQPNLFGYTIYVIQTDSMTGELEVGEAILSKRNAKYEVGSVVTFISQSGLLKGHPITHKIVKVYEENGIEMVQTQGVKPGAVLDTPIRADQIEAVMLKKINLPVNTVNFLQKPGVMFGLFLIPIILFAGYEMYIMFFMKKEEE